MDTLFSGPQNSPHKNPLALLGSVDSPRWACSFQMPPSPSYRSTSSHMVHLELLLPTGKWGTTPSRHGCGLSLQTPKANCLLSGPFPLRTADAHRAGSGISWQVQCSLKNMLHLVAFDDQLGTCGQALVAVKWQIIHPVPPAPIGMYRWYSYVFPFNHFVANQCYHVFGETITLNIFFLT